jgi:calcium-dependent protein kinase
MILVFDTLTFHSVIAYQSRSDQTRKLRRAFSIVDTDKSGEISYDQFHAAFLQSGVASDSEIEKLFNKVDFKKEKKIDYTEFVAATIESQGLIEECRIAEAFRRIDIDNTGIISRENLRALFNNSESDEYITSLLQEADSDGDGIVNYDDFRRLFVQRKKEEIRESLSLRNLHWDDMDEEGEENEPSEKLRELTLKPEV